MRQHLVHHGTPNRDSPVKGVGKKFPYNRRSGLTTLYALNVGKLTFFSRIDNNTTLMFKYKRKQMKIKPEKRQTTAYKVRYDNQAIAPNARAPAATEVPLKAVPVRTLENTFGAGRRNVPAATPKICHYR